MRAATATSLARNVVRVLLAVAIAAGLALAFRSGLHLPSLSTARDAKARDEHSAGKVIFAAPVPAKPPAVYSEPGQGDTRDPKATSHALAFHWDTHVYSQPDSGKNFAGTLRRGMHLGVIEKVSGKGCARGSWYKLRGDVYGCTSLGFQVSTEHKPFWIRQIQPNRNRPVPHRYGKAVRDALRFYRPPTLEEQAEIDKALVKASSDGKAPNFPDVVESRMSGDYLLALDRIEEDAGRKFFRTIRGRYVRAQDVVEEADPVMVGAHLNGKLRLPLAFVYHDDGATVLRLDGDEVREVGRAEDHARFPVAEQARWGNTRVVIAPTGYAVARNHVRLARAIPRPAGISPTDTWIHIHVPEQTLVAYEGDRPVFATLISSGRDYDGYVTPDGQFRIQRKLLTTTMSATDPKEGAYEVEEVPWTMYFYDSFAVHGAYWHNRFGNKKSHGCVNVAPIDARWLFNWSTPKLPEKWHAISGRADAGTWIYVTTHPEDGDEGSAADEVISSENHRPADG